MYLHFPVIDTVLSHRRSALPFCDVVNGIIEKHFQIEALEEKIAREIMDYATDYNLTVYASEYTATFKRYFRILISEFKRECQRLKGYSMEEKDMSSELHEKYLKTLAIIEVIGHLILNPMRFKLQQNFCVNCEPYYITVNQDISSSWARRVITRIDLPENDKEICYRFGTYNAQKRDFD